MKKNYSLLIVIFLFFGSLSAAPLNKIETRNFDTRSTSLPVNPIFTQVAPICSGDVLADLPLTSTNSISGTWAPAINNLATTTYTFTPTAGQDANTATMTIVVNIKPVLSFTANPFPLCVGSSSVLSANANNITPTLSYGTQSANILPAFFGTPLTSPLAGNLVNSPNNGCGAVSPYTPGQFTGKIVLIERGVCAFNEKAINAQNAGAIAVIIYNSAAGLPGPGDVFAPGGANPLVTIPVYGVSRANGLALIAAMTAGELPITLAPAAALTYLWSTGATTQTINSGVLNVDTPFTVTVTNPATGCAVTTTVNAAVTQNIVPTFAQVAPICLGDALAALPTASTNAVPLNGIWSPAINATATTTYTFTPTPVAGQCLSTATMTIVVTPLTTNTTTVAACGTYTWTVNGLTYTQSGNYPVVNGCNTEILALTITPIVAPAFVQVAPICSGATLADLPLTSTNGITGTWSPAINSAATTNYTFTPTGSPCSPTAFMTIVVNTTPVLGFTANPFPICVGSSSVLSANANNITPTISYGTQSANILPALFGTPLTSPLAGNLVNSPNNGCGTVSPYTPGQFTGKIVLIERGVCAFNEKAINAQNAGAIAVIIYNSAAGLPGPGDVFAPGGANPLVTIPVYGVSRANGLALIAAMTAGELPITLAPAAALTYLWSTGATTQTINSGVLNVDTPFTVTVTNPATGCAVTTTVNAAVTQNIVPTFAQVAPICLGDALAALPTASTNAVPLNGTWSPAINATATTTYTFTPTPVAGQCLSTATMTIVVNSVSNVTTVAANVITATEVGATYQWVDCNNANAQISGATSQSYSPIVDGSYAVLVTLNGCVAPVSTCTVITGLATNSFANKIAIELYPNPSSGLFNLKLASDLNIEVYNNLGQVIVSQKMLSGDRTLDISEKPSGVYFLKVRDGNDVSTYKIVKK